MGTIKREPALIVGAVASVLALLVSFGVNITETQTEAILQAVTALLPLAAAIVTRFQVTPKGEVVAQKGKGGEVVSGPGDELAPTGTPVYVLSDDTDL